MLIIAVPRDKDLPGLAFSLNDFPIRQALWARVDATGGASLLTGQTGQASLYQSLAQKSIPLTTAGAGQAIDLGQGASLSVVSQTPTGTLLLLSWNSFRALLPVGTVDDQ